MKPILAFLLLCGATFAETVAIYTQRCTIAGCETGRGSGVVIGKTRTNHWVIATAKHVVQGQQKVYIYAGNNWILAANAYPLPGEYDAAFVTLAYDGEFKPVDISEDDAGNGEKMGFDGFVGGLQYAKGTGTVESVGVAVTNPGVKQGQSGGGVYVNGALVGIVNAYETARPERLLYAPMGEVRKACLRQWGCFWGRCRPRNPPVMPAPSPAPTPIPAPSPAPTPIPGDQTPLPDAPIPQAGPAGPQGPPGADGKDADAAVIAALKVEINSLRADVLSLREILEKPNQTRVLYFTSRNVTRVAATDVIARELKNAGKPVTIITLDPREIDENNVRDVPRVFVLPEGQSHVGVDAVTSFLTQLKD